MIEILQAVEGLPAGWCGDLLSEDEARLICSGVARAVRGPVPALNTTQVRYFNLGQHALPDGALMDMAVVGSLASLVASGAAKGGPCRLLFMDCTVAAGDITVYDSTSADGLVVQRTTGLIEGRGVVNAVFTIGCYVVLSDPAARVTLAFA